MQVEEIINRSVVYFAFSVTAGLTYSAVLLASGWLIGDRLLSTKTNPTSWGAMVAALSVIVVLIAFRGGSRGIPAGDRPPVLSREVQVRSGHAENERWRSAAWLTESRWAIDCWKGRWRSCGSSGERFYLCEPSGKRVSARGLSRPVSRPANAGTGQSAGGSASAEPRRRGFPMPWQRVQGPTQRRTP